MSTILQKYVRDALGISRRKAEEFITEGKVLVNGTVAKSGVLVEEAKDLIVCNGKKIRHQKQEFEYILLNKPAGFVTTRFDPEKRKTVYSLLPPKYKKLFPVGRLDLGTEGLLVLTNDGDITYKLTHPKFQVEKEYFVTIQGSIKPSELAKIKKGLNTKEIKTSPCKIELLKPAKNGMSDLTVILHEGQKREIKRIFDTFDCPVVYLKRLRLAKLTLGSLAKGKWRVLTATDLKLLVVPSLS